MPGHPRGYHVERRAYRRRPGALHLRGSRLQRARIALPSGGVDRAAAGGWCAPGVVGERARSIAPQPRSLLQILMHDIDQFLGRGNLRGIPRLARIDHVFTDMVLNDLRDKAV